MVALFYAIVEDARQWEAFKESHHCVKVAQISGDVFNTVSVGPNGQVMVGVWATPDKTGWKCDDGVTYYR